MSRRQTPLRIKKSAIRAFARGFTGKVIVSLQTLSVTYGTAQGVRTEHFQYYDDMLPFLKENCHKFSAIPYYGLKNEITKQTGDALEIIAQVAEATPEKIDALKRMDDAIDKTFKVNDVIDALRDGGC